MLVVLRKGVFITLLFFAVLFALNTTIFADDAANRFYSIGYEYSQKSQNATAFRWMLRVAEAGHAAAQNNIGLSYLHGLGVEKDLAKAFDWFEKSAKQGLSYAQSELAMLYYQQHQLQRAQYWWSLAARQNDEYAQFNLASLLLEQNHIQQAYDWFNKALDNKHPGAQAALDELRQKYDK